MIGLLALALKTTLVLGGVLLLCKLRHWSAGERHLLLALALASLPLLVLTEQLPGKSVTVTAPAALVAWELELDAPMVAAAGSARGTSPAFSVSMKWTVAYAYAVVAGALLCLWTFRLLWTRRWIGRTRDLGEHPACEHCPVPVRVSSSMDSPVTWGLLHPEIVLPPSWQQWPVSRRQAVLAHELAHVHRRDTLTSVVAELICCAFWIHPLVWIVRRRMKLEAERACDDAVVDAGFPPLEYADALLETARSRRIGTALAAASQSTLPIRICALLRSDLRRTPMNRIRFFIITISALAVVAPLGSVGAAGLDQLSRLTADSEPTLIARVLPVYPKQAENDGIEGYAVVEFTVTESGRTADARVVEADPPGVFERAALNAVARYRYTPRVVDGQPQAVGGIRNRITFALGSKGEGERMPASQVPSMSEPFYLELSAVQSLLDAEDLEAAASLIDRMKQDLGQLNGNEIAQLHNMAGFVDYSIGDYWGAVAEYEQVLAQREAAPAGLRLQTLYTLAQLNYVNEEYQAALRHIRQWAEEAGNPGPTPQVFMGQVYYQLQDYPAAIEHMVAGLAEARSRGIAIRESWWGLLAYLYLEEQRWQEAEAVLERLDSEFPAGKYSRQLQEVRHILAEQQA